MRWRLHPHEAARERIHTSLSVTPSGWHAADPPQRPVLFVNPKSGGGKAEHAGVAEHAHERGIEVVEVRSDSTSKCWSTKR